MKPLILAVLLLSLATAAAQRRVGSYGALPAYSSGAVGADAASEAITRKHRADDAARAAIQARQAADAAASSARITADIANAIAPFRQWSDGSVAYIGKYVYQREGVIPATPEAARIKLVTQPWQALDITDAGVRVKIDGDDHDFFVRGLRGVFSDRAYSQVLMLRSTSASFTYATVIGGSRTIPEFEFGTQITKDQYTRALAPAKTQNDLAAAPPATNTPAR